MSVYPVTPETNRTNGAVYSAASTPQTRRERAWLDQMLKAKEPTYVRQTITPSLAEMMLGTNTRNRSVRRLVVTTLARHMSAGAFKDTFEPIAFGSDGVQTKMIGAAEFCRMDAIPDGAR